MNRDYFKYYNANFANMQIWSKSNTTIGTGVPKYVPELNKYSIVSISIKKYDLVTLTGYVGVGVNDVQFFEVTYNLMNSIQYGYIHQDDLTNFTNIPPTEKGGNVEKTEITIKELIFYNKEILQNNLLGARIFEYCQQRGVVFPNKHKHKLNELQKKLNARNEAMKNNQYVQKYEEGISPDFSVYNQTLINWMNNNNYVGLVVSTTAVIVTAIILITATAASAYMYFSNLHKDAKLDYKYSNELTAELIKLLPQDVYNRLMSENAANLAQAQKAIAAAKYGSTFRMLKYFAIGFGGFYLFDKFLYERSKRD